MTQTTDFGKQTAPPLSQRESGWWDGHSTSLEQSKHVDSVVDMSSSRMKAPPFSTPHELGKRKRGAPDFIGHTIENIYQTHLDHWIIYKSDAVHCEVADELKNEDQQQFDAYLNRLGEIQDLRSQVKQLLIEVKHPEKYDGSIADAMAMALRNNIVPARNRLEEILINIRNDIYTVARFRYLEFTFIGALFFLPAMGLAAWMTRPPNSEAFNLILAGTAGLVGAIFSIATQIRSRGPNQTFELC